MDGAVYYTFSTHEDAADICDCLEDAELYGAAGAVHEFEKILRLAQHFGQVTVRVIDEDAEK